MDPHKGIKAGLIQLDKHKEEILAVLPHTADIAELFSLESWSSSNMLLIYLDQMPAQPPPVQKHLDLLQRDQLFQRARKSFDWHLLASALKFPPQVNCILLKKSYSTLLTRTIIHSCYKGSHPLPALTFMAIPAGLNH